MCVSSFKCRHEFLSNIHGPQRMDLIFFHSAQMFFFEASLDSTNSTVIYSTEWHITYRAVQGSQMMNPNLNSVPVLLTVIELCGSE